MLELFLGIGVCVLMGKIATADNLSAPIWFVITFVLCVLSLFMPLPYLRFLAAGFVAFVSMIGYKMATNN